jgi:hypothetical protein
MAVGMAVAAKRMTMIMAMAMMVVPEGYHADQVDQQAERTDHEQLAQPPRLSALDYPLASLRHDLHAD